MLSGKITHEDLICVIRGGGRRCKSFFFAGVRGKIEFKNTFGALFLPPLYVFLYKNHIYIFIFYLLK